MGRGMVKKEERGPDDSLPVLERKENDVLELENIWKVYGKEVKVEALKGVSLNIQRDDFVSIMGPSGSGKSTLMHIIGCLLRPTKGEVKIDGLKISELSESQLATIRGKKVGFVFQQFNLLPRMNALRNVSLPLIFQGVEREKRKKRARELLEEVGMGDRTDHKPNELSGGQKQRVAIARALAPDPAIILADEPTGNLDTGTGEEIMKIFKDLNSQGRTLVMVTHEHHIAEWAERHVSLKDGEIVGSEENEKGDVDDDI